MKLQDAGKRSGLILLLLLSLAAGIASGQASVNSPYTRFGLGYIVERGLDPRSMAMGGLHYGLQINDHINTANPASYSAFDSSTFIFDAGVFGILTKLRTASLEQNGNYISLSHLLFGFPVTRWWKTSLGVLPFSYVGYNVSNLIEVPDVGAAKYIYRGSGGLNQVYWGNAFKIGKRLSVGFNLKYLFGTASRDKGVSFPDSIEIKNTYIKGSFTPSDIYGEIGLQYKTTFKKKYYLVAGAVFGPQVQIFAKGTYLATSNIGSIGSVSLYPDTVEFIEGQEGRFTMPIRTGAGVSVGSEGHWLAGVDFMWQNWENYTYFGNSDSLNNIWRITVGGEYIPNSKALSSYFKTVHYRLGFHYGMTQFELKGKRLNEFGIAFGLGFPVRKLRSTINASLEAGKLGTTELGLIQENFLRFTIGVNVVESWFRRYKYQ